MNIDIVNKQVALKNNVKESEVELINKFYWHKVKEHLYGYTELPINIQNVCVFYPTAYHTKKQILYYIYAIRKLKISTRYKENSIVREARIKQYKDYIGRIWKIRKQNQWTN